MKVKKNNYSTENVNLDNVHGNIEFRLTNDYMFRAVFQSNKKALKGVLCAILHLKEEDITDVNIENPIELGKSITDKEFVLDIKVTLNHNATVNLEMQVYNEGNWKWRSLTYNCRMYDELNSGDKYTDAHPVIQIGILDFTLFDDNPRFFSTYMLKDIDTGYIYTDSFM